jgi:hypothetical protein
MAENIPPIPKHTPRAGASRRHTLSPSSSNKQPLSQLIQHFENNQINSCKKQTGAISKDDISLLTPTKLDVEDKENMGKVSEIVLKFKGNSVVKNRDVFFQTLLERRNEDIRSIGGSMNCSSTASVNSVAVKSMNSPVKVEFMKAWVNDVISKGELSPNAIQAQDFLADFGVKESEVGSEEWTDWSEAMRIAQEHGKNSVWVSPLADISLSLGNNDIKLSRSALAYKIELDSSIDALSIKMAPQSTCKNDISFDVDEGGGSSYSEHMMSQYPSLTDSPAFTFRSESLESVSLANSPIICPVVRMPVAERSSCDSNFTSSSMAAKSQQQEEARGEQVPKGCMSWFKCF